MMANLDFFFCGDDDSEFNIEFSSTWCLSPQPLFFSPSKDDLAWATKKIRVLLISGGGVKKGGLSIFVHTQKNEKISRQGLLLL